MKLITARVQNYRSIEDTGEFEIDDLTCLVGKNEAGKTAILQAIEAQRPYSYAASPYDITKDYPRRFVTEFSKRHPSAKATVCTTKWKLDDIDKTKIEEEFGKDFLTNDIVTIDSGYNFTGTTWHIPLYAIIWRYCSTEITPKAWWKQSA